MAKKQLLDSDGVPTGNAWNRAEVEESNDNFSSLFEQQDGCPYCGFDGQLRSTRKGYKCPECREIVIPAE